MFLKNQNIFSSAEYLFEYIKYIYMYIYSWATSTAVTVIIRFFSILVEIKLKNSTEAQDIGIWKTLTTM